MPSSGRPLAIALLALAATASCSREATTPPGKDGKKGDPAQRPIPVLVAKVEKKDVPLWIEGLGAVAAWQQVTVRSQVDGRLDKVFFKEGQVVKRGDLLAQIDPRPFEVQLHTGEGALARDDAQLTSAKLNLVRNETLVKDKLVAQQTVDDQRALVGQAEGAVKMDQATIESARLNLDYAKVRAPIDGTVGVRLVDAGNIVHAADPTGLVVLTQLDPAAVFVTLPQDDLARLGAAMARGDVPVEVYARDGKERIAIGKVAALDNQINASTSTLRFKAQLPNADHKLWPNEFVKARVLVDTVQGALVVPAAAVQRGPQASFVYLVAADQTAEMKPIEVRTITGDVAIVAGDLAVGADIVVEGQGQLRPGAKLALRDAGGSDKGDKADKGGKAGKREGKK